MKVYEIITISDSLKENQLSDEVKMNRINEVEARVFCEIFGKSPKDFNGVRSFNDELSVPIPYTRMYTLYLGAMSAFADGEYELYNQMTVDFEKIFSEYAKYCIRHR